jgi:hypothetical protein
MDTRICSLCSGVGELVYNPQHDSDETVLCTCHICNGLGQVPNIHLCRQDQHDYSEALERAATSFEMNRRKYEVRTNK